MKVGELEDPKMHSHNTEMYSMVTPPEKAKDELLIVDIYFNRGVPEKVNGKNYLQ